MTRFFDSLRRPMAAPTMCGDVQCRNDTERIREVTITTRLAHALAGSPAARQRELSYSPKTDAERYTLPHWRPMAAPTVYDGGAEQERYRALQRKKRLSAHRARIGTAHCAARWPAALPPPTVYDGGAVRGRYRAGQGSGDMRSTGHALAGGPAAPYKG